MFLLSPFLHYKVEKKARNEEMTKEPSFGTPPEVFIHLLIFRHEIVLFGVLVEYFNRDIFSDFSLFSAEKAKVIRFYTKFEVKPAKFFVV